MTLKKWLDQYKWKRRLLIVYSNSSTNTNYVKLKEELNKTDTKERMYKYYLKVLKVVNDKYSFKMDLYGYDSGLKLSLDKFTKENWNLIFETINEMPMRETEINSDKYKKHLDKMPNYSLYTDDNPKETLKGTGFKDKETAEKTLKLIKNKDSVYQKRLINTLYNRAKHHPHKTKDMKDAMKIFKEWLNKN